MKPIEPGCLCLVVGCRNPAYSNIQVIAIKPVGPGCRVRIKTGIYIVEEPGWHVELPKPVMGSTEGLIATRYLIRIDDCDDDLIYEEEECPHSSTLLA